MNGGIREKELPKRFATDEFQILIVAEKYQTGFDQPLLHTMYVDKRLAGVAAVQTLSRLNRTAPGKEETFVLDFINTAEEIQAAFQPYYEQTVVGERAEVGQLYDLQARLNGYQIFFTEEVEAFAKVFYAPKEKQTAADQAKLYALLGPALHRFGALGEEEQDEFRGVLSAYRNLYGFLSQIIPFQDSDLEKLYTFVRFLIAKLPRRPDGPGYWFDEEVALQFYRLQKISEGAIHLEKGVRYEIDGPTSVGTGYVAENPIELSRLIEILNEHFGTDFTEADQLFFDSIQATAAQDPRLRRAAKVNSIENFELIFADELERIFSRRMDQNEKIADRFFSEEAFRYAVSKYLLQRVYTEIRDSSA
jgi:type I restriction enzyme R subunit